MPPCYDNEQYLLTPVTYPNFWERIRETKAANASEQQQKDYYPNYVVQGATGI